MGIETIGRLHAAIAAAGIPIDGVADLGGNAARVDYQAAATGPQRTQGAAIVAGFDWSATADATYAAQQSKIGATNSIDYGALQRGSVAERLVRALALVLLDEVNLMRAAIPHRIVSITRVTTVATAITPAAHGLSPGDPLAIAGADVAGYNVVGTVATVPNATTFTYAMANAGVTPATGSLSYTNGVVPATSPRTAAQLVTAIKAQIAATAE